MTQTATIKIFLIHGDPKGLLTAEISNWSGKAIAGPRTDFDLFIQREEATQSGVYILTGFNPDTGKPQAYIGEAEELRQRIPDHRNKDFWSHAIAFVSKDENLTKSHIRYLEGRLIDEARKAGRYDLTNSQVSGSKLPEADRFDMEVFLGKVRQLLPALGSELLTPIATAPISTDNKSVRLFCTISGLRAEGERTASGFVIFSGSQAVLKERASAPTRSPNIVTLRRQLQLDGILVTAKDYLLFTKDAEFSSPSAAAGIIYGGSANGLEAWRDASGRVLKQIEEGQ